MNKSNEYLIDINLEVKGNEFTEFTELICVEVDDFKDVPNGMIGMNIPTQTYACMNHNGKVEDIWRSFGELQKWIVEIGQTVDPTDFKMDFSLDDSTSPHILYQKIL